MVRLGEFESVSIGKASRQEKSEGFGRLVKDHEYCYLWNQCKLTTQSKHLKLYVQGLYILSLIYAWQFKVAGPVFDAEGNTVGENFGVTWWDIIGLGLFTLVTRTTSSMIKDTVG